MPFGSSSSLSDTPNRIETEAGTSDLPFRTSREFGAVRFEFPARPALGLMGTVLVFFGVVVLGFALFWNGILWFGLRGSLRSAWPLALLGLIPLFLGAGIVLIGRAMRQGRSGLEVELRGTTLWRSDRFGAIRFRHRVRLRNGVQISMRAVSSKFPAIFAVSDRGSHTMSSVVVLGGSPAEFVVAWGYPGAMLSAFGRALTEELNALAKQEGWSPVGGWVQQRGGSNVCPTAAAW